MEEATCQYIGSGFLTTNKRVRRNFYKANYDEVSRNLSEMNWKLLLRDMATEPDLTLETFYSSLNSLRDVHVPNKSLILIRNGMTPKLLTLVMIKNVHTVNGNLPIHYPIL